MIAEKIKNILREILYRILAGVAGVVLYWIGTLALGIFDIDSWNIITEESYRRDGPLVRLGAVLWGFILGVGVPIAVGVVCLAIPSIAAFFIYQKWFWKRKALFATIVSLLFVGIGGSLFLVYKSRENERNAVLGLVDELHSQNYIRPARYVVRTSDPLNCSFVVDVVEQKVATKVGQGVYEFKKTFHIEKEEVKLNEREEYGKICLAIYRTLVDTSELRTRMRLEKDNRTLIDMDDNTIAGCIPFGEKERVCKDKQGMMVSRVAPDGCMETKDQTKAGIIIDSYDCPKGINRPMDIPIVSMKGKAPVSDKPDAAEVAMTFEIFLVPH